MSDNNKLKVKLIITIILFLLAIAMLILGIWAAQAGNYLFKGNVDVMTEGINARVTAYVTGTKKKTGEGYDSEKLIWDSANALSDNADWKDIDFTFADKNSEIVLTINVENRNVQNEINSVFTAKLGEEFIETTEKEIGDTNIIAYIIAPSGVGNALDEATSSVATYQVVLKIGNKNKSVKSTQLEVELTLTDPEFVA